MKLRLTLKYGKGELINNLGNETKETEDIIRDLQELIEIVCDLIRYAQNKQVKAIC